MKKNDATNNSSKNTHGKKRRKIEREKHLAAIAAFERLYPTKYANLDLFAEAVSKQLKIAVSTAKKDIQEVRRRLKERHTETVRNRRHEHKTRKSCTSKNRLELPRQ